MAGPVADDSGLRHRWGYDNPSIRHSACLRTTPEQSFHRHPVRGRAREGTELVPGTLAHGACSVTREQLSHVLRAVSQITGESDVLVIGSQSILGSYSENE